MNSYLGRIAFIILVALSVVRSVSAQPVDGLKLEDKGSLVAGPFSLEFIFFDPGYKRATSAKDGFFPAKAETTPSVSVFEGEFIPKGTVSAPFKLRTQMTWAAPGKGLLSYALTKEAAPIRAGAVGAQLYLPFALSSQMKVRIDGRLIDLEDEESKPWIKAPKSIKSVEISTTAGRLVLSGSLSVILQDARPFKKEAGQLRFLATPSDGEFETAELTIHIAWTPATFDVLNLTPAVNRSLSDDVAGDGKGGWTDQGPDQDMRLLPPGEHRWQGIPWRVLDTEAASGNQIIALRGPGAPKNPDKADLPLAGQTIKTLFVLHDTAWTPQTEKTIGRIILTGADGRAHVREVKTREDVGDWLGGTTLPNGVVAWEGLRPVGRTVAYLSRYEFPSVVGKSLRFESTGAAQWLILGATTSPDEIPLPRPSPDVRSVITANDEWRPLSHRLETVAGSALDFSGWVEAPAGRHGAVITHNGHFAFSSAPETPVRFFGANLCFAATWPDHATADVIARRFRMMGYNLIRLHHIDSELYTPEAREVKPDVLDKIQYLCAALKREGLYISLDLYSARTYSTKLYPVLGHNIREEIKALLPIDNDAMELWKEGARNLLLAPNPHTGIPLGHDPVLQSVCLVNEDPILVVWDRDPQITKLYQQRFDRWLQAEGKTNLSNDKRDALFKSFMVGLQGKAYQTMREYLHGEGVVAPVTASNYGLDMGTMWARTGLDYVDNHSYWDHPIYFKGRVPPYAYIGESDLTVEAKTPRELFPTRIFGLPFAVTEFNFCYPNAYRAEGGPLMGAYAGLQNWDMLVRFAYSHNLTRMVEPSAPLGFDVAPDPVNTLADRIISLLFLRGDVAPARRQIAYRLPADGANPGTTGSFSSHFSQLGLVSAIGTVPTGQDFVGTTVQTLPSGEADARRILVGQSAESGKNAGVFEPKEGRYVSDTGEVTLDREAGMLTVLTPKSEVFTLNDSDQGEGTFAQVRKETRNAATIAVLSLDDQPLAGSARILILHLTDAQGTGATFSNQKHMVMEKWGALPLLARQGRTRLQLAIPGTASVWTLYALNTDGSRVSQLPVSREEKTLGITLDVMASGAPVFAYELVKTP